MLDRVKYTTIRDICIKDFIVYDPEKEKDLIAFCKEYSISFIPDKDRKSYWRLKDDTFQHIKSLSDDVTCRPEALIFAKETVAKFKKGNHDEVMFVVEDGLIKGVVHIVDYNNDDLYVGLYRMLLNFEKNVRALLVNKQLTNQDFIDWLKKMGEKNSFYYGLYKKETDQRNIQKQKNANPFQTFYLKDLLSFAQSENLLSYNRQQLTDINGLRNWIAHSKDATTIKPDSDHPVYNLKGLLKFIDMTSSFFEAYEQLELIIDHQFPSNNTLFKDYIPKATS